VAGVRAGRGLEAGPRRAPEGARSPPGWGARGRRRRM